MNQNQVPIDEEFFRQRLQNLLNQGDRQTFQPNSSRVAQNQTSFGASGGTKQKKPPTFDGKGSFRDFLVQFEMISHMCQWDEHMIALELAASLRGSANEVLSDLETHERCHYPTLVNALYARFEPQNQSQLYKALLKGRIRRGNEPLPELAHDLKRLVRRAYPDLTNSMRDIIAKDAFLDSLNNKELELAVFQSQPVSLQGAPQVAVQFEAFQTSRHRREPPLRECFTENEFVDEVSLGSRISKLEEELKVFRMSNEPSQVEGKNLPKSDTQMIPVENASVKKTGMCFSCGHEGHFKVNCPKANVSKSKKVCYFCGNVGHVIVDCRLKGRTVEMALCLFCEERDHFMVNCDKYNKVNNMNNSSVSDHLTVIS